MDIFLNSIKFSIGLKTPISSLKNQNYKNNELIQLLAKGMKYYRISDKSLYELAFDSAIKTLQHNNFSPEDIDLLICSTNSKYDNLINYCDFGNMLLKKLNLTNAYLMGISMQGCADVTNCLKTSQSLIKSKDCKNILVVLVDKVIDSGVNLITNNSRIHSDGASSCIITNEKLGAQFQLLGTIIRHVFPIESNKYDSSSIDKKMLYFIKAIIKTLLNKLGLAISDINWFITLNFNNLYISSIANYLKISEKIFFTENIASMGHCFGSDILINLLTLQHNIKLTSNKKILFFATSPYLNSFTAGVFQTL